MARPSPGHGLRVVRGGLAPADERSKSEAPRSGDVPGRAPLLDDAEILAALRDGDAKAATSLYRRTRPQVEATVRRLLGHGDPEHEDLVQTSMIAIVESIDRFRGESSLDTWVARVTANTVFKAIRRRGTDRRRTEQHAGDKEARAESVDGSPAQLESRDLVKRVRAVLSEMDPVKAYTILLHDLREIAGITDVSVAAAQSRLVRGRAELHERIERDPELAELLSRRYAR
jgi:RNA polymerase sigma-70 factor, ECF subfamily